MGAALAIARAYRGSSTRTVQERISLVMDAISQTVARSETRVSGLRTIADRAASVKSEARAVGDAS